jgi:hypothetical protein
MNYNIILFLVQYFGFLTLIPLLTRNFGSVQGVCLLFLMNNRLFPILAQSFSRAQGLGSAESGIVLLYSEHFGLCRKRSDRKKESPKCKTNPIQSQTKPIFWRSIFDFSQKTRIFDKFRTYFLCKTKPISKANLIYLKVVFPEKNKKFNFYGQFIIVLVILFNIIPLGIGCLKNIVLRKEFNNG